MADTTPTPAALPTDSAGTTPASTVVPAAPSRRPERAPTASTSAPAEQSAETGTASETEPAQELEPEVEKAIERIEEHKVPSTAETAVGAATKPTVTPNTVAQPVVVLPLSEQEMQTAPRASLSQSIRWLYTWCVRQIRRFKDTLVVYREK